MLGGSNYGWQACVEHLCATFNLTWPDYLEEMERRVAAAVLLWAPSIPDGYLNAQISRFVSITREKLEQDCRTSGYRPPDVRDLSRMTATGAYPGESRLRIWRRHAMFTSISRSQGMRR
jgi:hypothetical protein